MEAGMVLPEPPEFIRTAFLIIRSKLLVEIAKARFSQLESEMVRAQTLRIIALEILSPRVQEVLLNLPLDRSWTPGAGPHADILGRMLDEGSLLVEEDEMPEDGDAPWRVRLTEMAVEILA
jgi:hypothetical protein